MKAWCIVRKNYYYKKLALKRSLRIGFIVEISEINMNHLKIKRRNAYCKFKNVYS